MQAITAEHLSKEYRLGSGASRYGRLSESVVGAFRGFLSGTRKQSADRRLWALRDVNVVIGEGEVVGLIGHNGAGKSTLLKILTRITAPTTGRVVLNGRVGSLLEVGTGFHPELTGRENIFLNGSILGMKRNEIRNHFDDIVAFAEIERFLDTPVKRYSSGMYVRLAFAVAAHLQTEILLVDEVLAVGDASFQRKCLGKMSDVATAGRTVVLVSHNMAAIEGLCNRVLLLSGGAVEADGPSTDVIQKYAQLVSSIGAQDLTQRQDRRGSGRLRFTRVRTTSGDGSDGLVCGADAKLIISYEAAAELTHVHISIAIRDSLGRAVAYLSNEIPGDWFERVPRAGKIECSMPRVPLLPGQYTLTLFSTVAGDIADWIVDAAIVEVFPGDFYRSGKLPPPEYGPVAIDYRWAVNADMSE